MPAATGVAELGTRERLVRAAAELLEDGGHAAASVAAVTHRAGITPAALYRHFPTKADLIVEVLRDVGARELDAMRDAAAGAGDAAAQLDAVVATYARGALAHPRLAWALVHEPVEPLVDAERLAFRRAYAERLAALLRAGKRDGELAVEDPELTAAAIVGAIAETLVGPLSPVAPRAAREDTVTAIVALCRRLAGAR